MNNVIIKNNNIYLDIYEVLDLLECSCIDENYATDIITDNEDEYINIDNVLLLVAHNYKENKLEILEVLLDIIDNTM